MRDPNHYSVYHKAHALAVRIANLATPSSTRRQPGLSPQIRKAATSVATNIAEGCGHSSQREFARFLQLALASAAEVDYYLTFAVDVNAITREQEAELRSLNTEVRRMLASLLRKVRDDLTDDDDDDSVAAMQRRRTPRPPIGNSERFPCVESECHK